AAGSWSVVLLSCRPPFRTGAARSPEQAGHSGVWPATPGPLHGVEKDSRRADPRFAGEAGEANEKIAQTVAPRVSDVRVRT
ncbi:hypothetical protein, partial [Streptomyces sp. SID3343]|uniref:hypothetical protein n=1 Tax=Streptomyces sp. SID3343 TaxID=2690260 RepID=UPI0013C17FF7